MKSKITIILCVVLCIAALSGCGKGEKYSKAEQEAIKDVNSMVEEKYKIEIDESNTCIPLVSKCQKMSLWIWIMISFKKINIRMLFGFCNE